MSISLYCQEPNKIVDGIPCFIVDDEYTNNYNLIAKTLIDNIDKYGTNPFIEDSLWTEAQDITLQVLRKYIKKDFNILDIGVGLGNTLSRIDTETKKYGIDITLSQLKHCMEKGIDVALAKAEKLPYISSFFDIIICTDVLEHVLDLNATINEMDRVLKKGGHAIIRVPYKENLEAYLSKGYQYKFGIFSLRLILEKTSRFVYIESKGVNYFFLSNKFKFKVPFENYVVDFARRTRKFTGKLEKRIAKIICDPVEMIFVFTKI